MQRSQRANTHPQNLESSKVDRRESEFSDSQTSIPQPDEHLYLVDVTMATIRIRSASRNETPVYFLHLLEGVLV
jgi:hypothetical protein